MKHIALIAPTGMLGNMMYSVLKNNFKLTLIYRNESHLKLLNKIHGDVNKHTLLKIELLDLVKENEVLDVSSTDKLVTNYLQKKTKNVDYILNCAGVINKFIRNNIENTFSINSIFPHILSKLYNEKLIHFSTDCVFDGKSNAPYSESSTPNPHDYYGLSKFFGEVSTNSLVLRTSFIGPEIHGHYSLHDWLLQQKGSVQGYTNHLWNGVTTKQLALICKSVIENPEKFPNKGLFHVFSTDVTKYELLQKIKQKYHLNVTVQSTKKDFIDRRLTSKKSFCKKLHIPSLDSQIADL